MNDLGPLMLGDRPVPFQKDIEEAVLSCFLQEPEACIPDIGQMRPDDFYGSRCRRIFETIAEMSTTRAAASIDTLAVIANMDSRGLLEDIGGQAELRRLTNAVPSTVNFQQHMATAKQFGRLRRFIIATAKAAGKSYEASLEEFPAILADAESALAELSDEGGRMDVSWVGNFTEPALKRMRGKRAGDIQYIGYKTGMDEFDEILGGLRNQEMIVLAARPSIGKTTFLLNVLLRLSETIPVACYSLEQSGEGLTEKMIHVCGGISAKTVLSGSTAHVEDCLARGVAKLNSRAIMLDETRGCYEDIISSARVAVRKYGVKAIAVDYFQLMRTAKEFKSDGERFKYMSNGIKEFAMDLNVPFIVLSQLNRAAEGSSGTMANLRNCGDLEQDADVVCIMHRERESEDQETMNDATAGKGIDTDFKFSKNRNGPTGKARLSFFPERSEFTNLVRGYTPQEGGI